MKDRAALQTSNDHAADSVSTGVPSVLLVEDDPTFRSAIGYNLKRAGYQLSNAADGDTALAIVKEQLDQIDLVVLDLMLPGASGIAVLRQIRARSNVPVLIVSARGEEQDKIVGLELGADDYIVKPFAMREFLARVRATLRRRSISPAQLPTVLLRGPLSIELDTQRARLDGAALSLSRKEFGLLRELALAPGHVFSRQQLLDLVWGTDIFVDERTIDVHVSWLRSKLKSAGGEEGMIRTVYGGGYSFEPVP